MCVYFMVVMYICLTESGYTCKIQFLHIAYYSRHVAIIASVLTAVYTVFKLERCAHRESNTWTNLSCSFTCTKRDLLPLHSGGYNMDTFCIYTEYHAYTTPKHISIIIVNTYCTCTCIWSCLFTGGV